jgi:hypothetical protein
VLTGRRDFQAVTSGAQIGETKTTAGICQRAAGGPDNAYGDMWSGLLVGTADHANNRADTRRVLPHGGRVGNKKDKG